MALSSDDTYNLLKEFNKYGATIFYLIETGKFKLEDVSNILFKKSIEQVSLVFPNFIKKIKISDIDEAYSKYEMEYSKLDCLYYIVGKEESKYTHLKEIKEIVNLENKVNEMVKDTAYRINLNTKYTGLILDKIEINEDKAFISIKETIKLYKNAYQTIKEENEKKISSNIDNYYINTITR